jgi:hypothetical protein
MFIAGKQIKPLQAPVRFYGCMGVVHVQTREQHVTQPVQFTMQSVEDATVQQ